MLNPKKQHSYFHDLLLARGTEHCGGFRLDYIFKIFKVVNPRDHTDMEYGLVLFERITKIQLKVPTSVNLLFNNLSKPEIFFGR